MKIYVKLHKQELMNDVGITPEMNENDIKYFLINKIVECYYDALNLDIDYENGILGEDTHDISYYMKIKKVNGFGPDGTHYNFFDDYLSLLEGVDYDELCSKSFSVYYLLESKELGKWIKSKDIQIRKQKIEKIKNEIDYDSEKDMYLICDLIYEIMDNDQYEELDEEIITTIDKLEEGEEVDINEVKMCIVKLKEHKNKRKSKI